MYYFLISHMFYYSRGYVSLLLLVLFSIWTIYLLQSCALHVITLDNCPMSRSYALHHFSRQKNFPWGVSVGRGSQVVGRGFQVVGRGSQVVGRGSQVVGYWLEGICISGKTVFRDPFHFKTNSFKSTTTNNTRFLSVNYRETYSILHTIDQNSGISITKNN